ncbi:MAG: hypothetical protein AB7O52_12580 [Planctomycetota bacterium]
MQNAMPNWSTRILEKAALFLSLLSFCATSTPALSVGQNLVVNGDFSDPSGAPWTLFDNSASGSVSYATMAAVVTGGDNQSTNSSNTFIEQLISFPGGTETVSFTWSYTSIDPDPNFDFAVWDLVDATTGVSVVLGPLTLTGLSGTNGTVMQTFTASGDLRLRLGTDSDDNLFGPGVTTFDDVFITGMPAGPQLVRGDCNDDGSTNLTDAVFLLNFLFPQGAPPALGCVDACDANDDGGLNIPDAVTLLLALFGMPTQPLPGPLSCGVDPTLDALDCVAFAHCP